MNEELKIIIRAVTADAQKNMAQVRKELDNIWKDMIKNGRKRSLPAKSFTHYYEGKYVDDMLYMGF